MVVHEDADDISPEEINAFAKLIRTEVRPVQLLNGRRREGEVSNAKIPGNHRACVDHADAPATPAIERTDNDDHLRDPLPD